MSSWFNRHMSIGSSKKIVDHRAWFLCKLLSRSIDEATYEQVRLRLVQSNGVETRVRLTADGWTSGSKKSARRVPVEFYPIDSVEALTADSVYANVVICVIRCLGVSSVSTTLERKTSATPMPTSTADLPFQILAYKFENESTPRRYVECFETIRRPPAASSSSDRHSTKKSKYSKRRKSGGHDIDVADVGDERTAVGAAAIAETAGRKKNSLMPGRPAAAGKNLAFDRWTVRDRSTPRLFASASLDDLLGATDTDVALPARRSAGTATNTIKFGVERSKSYDGQVDSVDDDTTAADAATAAGDREADAAQDGEVDLDDMDEDAAAAGAEFWDEPEQDGDATRTYPFRGGIVPADIVLRRPIGATAGVWTSVDDLVDRRSVDNWYVEGLSDEELVRCRDVGVTARFPAATDPKSRPECMECIHVRTADSTMKIVGPNVSDAQCQVDMPRLRQMDNNNNQQQQQHNIIEHNGVNKLVLSDEELDDVVDDADDDDGWDFGDDDKSTNLSTTAVVGEPISKFNAVQTSPAIKSSSRHSSVSSSTVVPDMSVTVMRVFSRSVVPCQAPRRERQQAGMALTSAAPVVVAVHQHRRHHSDSGLIYQQSRDPRLVTSPPLEPVSRRRPPRSKTFISPTGSRPVSNTSVSGRPASIARRPPSQASSSGLAHVQPNFEHHYRQRSGSGSVSGVPMSPPPPAPPMPPPPPSLAPQRPAGLTVRVTPVNAVRRGSGSGQGVLSPTSPGLPSPPPSAMLHHLQQQQQQHSSAASGHHIYANQNVRL